MDISLQYIGLVNSDTAEVAAVRGGHAAFRLGDGRTLELGKTTHGCAISTMPGRQSVRRLFLRVAISAWRTIESKLSPPRAVALLAEGHGRRYNGGRRAGWCG